MAIYDCFQYFNEDHIVDLRLNILNEYVDYFEFQSSKTIREIQRNLISIFKIFQSLKKRLHIIADYKIEKNFVNHTGGESPIEQHQRNLLIDGVKDANDEDLIILSDSDEIPDLSKLSEIKKIKSI